MSTKQENSDLYLKNFMQLGEALMNAGGNSFLILKKYDDFLRTLAANNIEVTAKYNYLEEAVPLKTTNGPNFRLTEDDWNSFGECHLRQDNNEWEEWMEKISKAQQELQKSVKQDSMWQKPLRVADPK